MYIHNQKSIENKKVKFLGNVKKVQNIPIKGGGSPQGANYIEIFQVRLITLSFRFLNDREAFYVIFPVVK